MKNIFAYFICFFLFSNITIAQNEITIDASKIKAPIQSTMWGIFFEDINFGADGGLYAELIKNRSFEFSMPMMGWKETKQNGGKGSLLINNNSSKPQNPRFIRITKDNAEGTYGIANEGFRGMGIQKDEQYNFSIWIKNVKGNASLKIELQNALGKIIGTASLKNFSKDWKQYQISFTATDTATKAICFIGLEGKGIVDADMISLFPQHTWKERKNGLRADLVQLLADMKPGFIRFPGGCIVEGRDLINRYQWKKTVGNIENRELIINRWNTEFKNKLTPDYFQSYGLGFYEYFLLAEDIGAEPLPILNCGMACQFNTAEVTSMENEDVYIQDALDLIEFANGAITTKWGKLRADMGHPKPFNLKMMGVGNENWGPQYLERVALFKKAINTKYPNIKLVGSSGTDPDGERFNLLNDSLRKMQMNFIDEHYYRPPSWFLQNANRYDHYDRKSSKIFAGEYAAHTKLTNTGEQKNNWDAALAEAAFITGLERNADVVQMASYAPLFSNIDAWQWAPDLIWFNNHQSYATPNYYVQKLFATNKGTHVVSTLLNNETISGKDSVYANAVIDKNKQQLIFKMVNASSVSKKYTINCKGIAVENKEGVWQTISNNNLTSFNSFEKPDNVVPVAAKYQFANQSTISFPPYSVNVIIVPVQF